MGLSVIRDNARQKLLFCTRKSPSLQVDHIMAHMHSSHKWILNIFVLWQFTMLFSLQFEGSFVGICDSVIFTFGYLCVYSEYTAAAWRSCYWLQGWSIHIQGNNNWYYRNLVSLHWFDVTTWRVLEETPWAGLLFMLLQVFKQVSK